MKPNLSNKSDQIAFSVDNGLDFYEERYASAGESDFHSHEETELILLLEGTVDDVRKKQTVRRTPVVLIMLPAGELHAPRVYGDVRLFEIRIQSQWLKRYQQGSLRLEAPADFHGGLPIWRALKVYQEFQSPDSLSPLMLEALTLELLIEMARSSQYPVPSRVPRWLKEARDLLHHTFRESLTLETIAAAAGVHPSHLTRAFRQHYHCTLGDYIRRLRIDYARHLIVTSDSPLSQIALEAGFAHQSHFCRAFKELTRMTPTEYQRVSGRCMSEAKNDRLRKDRD